MACMAESIWEITGTTILQLLDQNPNYTLTLVGHSLGAGVASLLNILLHQNQRYMIHGHHVECFAYAAPPTYTPLDNVPDAVSACINYINESDFVPFLSLDGVRHLIHCIRVIDEQSYPWMYRWKLMMGLTKPNTGLMDAVQRRMKDDRLIVVPGAPALAVPAKVNVWMRENKENGKFDCRICDSMELTRLGVLIDINMLEDHFPSRYEHAFHSFVESEV